MNTVELYGMTPAERHQEIVITGDRLFFEGEEYVIRGDGELKLVRSDAEVKQRLGSIEAKLTSP